MMKEVIKNTLKGLKIGAVGVVVYAATSVVIAVAIDIVSEKTKYNRHIKKGLKDGSVVCIDGKYYDVIVEDAQ